MAAVLVVGLQPPQHRVVASATIRATDLSAASGVKQVRT